MKLIIKTACAMLAMVSTLITAPVASAAGNVKAAANPPVILAHRRVCLFRLY
ncbi:MAG: hypothetical protein K2P61_05825 [Burkholderiaceae bacterium]|nr:hypothetical protein [Burkholderiaceae bacterium]